MILLHTHYLSLSNKASEMTNCANCAAYKSLKYINKMAILNQRMLMAWLISPQEDSSEVVYRSCPNKNNTTRHI